MTITKKPLITVVTITYNLINDGRKNYFRECCESVHNQTYQNIEHLVIDGGSSDGTINLLKEYEKKGWIRYISEPDKGRYDAMNKGIKFSKGEYITFLNSDDFYSDVNGIQSTINCLVESNADFSYAPVTDYDEGKNIKNLMIPDISKVFYTITPNHQTIVYKKKVIQSEGGYNTKYKCLSDYDLTLRLCLKNNKSVFSNFRYVTYRLGGFSKKASDDGTLFEEQSQIYFSHYSLLCKITHAECRQIIGRIYHSKLSNIPTKLAVELAQFKQYFNLERYINEKILIPAYLRKESKLTDPLTKTELKIIYFIRKTKHILIPEGSFRKKIFDIISSNLKPPKH